MIEINKIYFVRHGESEANAAKIFTHDPNANYKLTKKGIEQAKFTAGFFKEIDIDEIYSSQILRAFQTASYIAELKNKTVSKIEYFNELDLGYLEGKPIENEYLRFYKEISMQWQEGKIELPFKKGESLKSLAERMKKGIMKIIDLDKDLNILVAAHGGIIAGSLPIICDNINYIDFFKNNNMHVENCSVTTCEIKRSKNKIVIELIDWNNISHLLQLV